MEQKKHNYLSKIMLLILFISLILCSCSSNPTKPKRPEWVPGEILIILLIDVEGNDYEDFILSYSEYEFKVIKIISKRLKLVHFSFDYNKIFCKDFLAMIQEDPRVDVAQLNHIYYPD